MTCNLHISDTQVSTSSVSIQADAAACGMNSCKDMAAACESLPLANSRSDDES